MYDMFCNTGDTPYKRRHCDRCGKCFTKTTFLKMLGRSHFYKKNCEFCEKLFPKPTSQMTHMFYSHRRKDLQTQDCDICGKYFTKTTVTMMHKFCHSEAKPSLEGELRVLWKIVPKTNLPDELHVYFKHRRNAVIVISVENVYKNAVLREAPL